MCSRVIVCATLAFTPFAGRAVESVAVVPVYRSAFAGDYPWRVDEALASGYRANDDMKCLRDPAGHLPVAPATAQTRLSSPKLQLGLMPHHRSLEKNQ